MHWLCMWGIVGNWRTVSMPKFGSQRRKAWNIGQSKSKQVCYKNWPIYICEDRQKLSEREERTNHDTEEWWTAWIAGMSSTIKEAEEDETKASSGRVSEGKTNLAWKIEVRSFMVGICMRWRVMLVHDKLKMP